MSHMEYFFLAVVIVAFLALAGSLAIVSELEAKYHALREGNR